jgi:hypothetical protein
MPVFLQETEAQKLTEDAGLLKSLFIRLAAGNAE